MVDGKIYLYSVQPMPGEVDNSAIIGYAPYVLIGLLATNLGEAWRLAIGSNASVFVIGDRIEILIWTS